MSRIAYPPRLELPASGVTDAPLAGVYLNRAWLPVLLSACERLSTRWGWVEGTDVERAEQEALKLYLRIANAEGMIGAIFPYITDDPPPGMLPCDGSVHLRVSYPLLYARLPAALIIDADTFRTPDLRGRMVLGAAGSYPPLSLGGEASVTLAVSQIPAHTHTTQPHTHGYVSASPTLVTVGVEPPTASAVPLLGVTDPALVMVDAAGGGEAHNNLPPYIALHYGMVAV